MSVQVTSHQFVSPNVATSHKYALDVAGGKIFACKYAKLACKRYLNDLARADRGWVYEFDEERAERVIKFVQALPHVKGKWARTDPATGKPQKIVLEPWQKWVVNFI